MLTYKKTPKGMNELMARRSSIDAGLNSLLVLVDGKRSEAEIRRLGLLAKIPSNALETLVRGGYLESVGARSALPTALEYGTDFYLPENEELPAAASKPQRGFFGFLRG